MNAHESGMIGFIQSGSTVKTVETVHTKEPKLREMLERINMAKERAISIAQNLEYHADALLGAVPAVVATAYSPDTCGIGLLEQIDIALGELNEAHARLSCAAERNCGLA